MNLPYTAESPRRPIGAARLELPGGAPIALPVGVGVWRVVQGTVEAHLVWSGGRHLIARLESGALAFGMSDDERSDDAQIRMVAPGGAVLERQTDLPDDVSEEADAWVRDALARVELAPPPAQADTDADALVGARQGGVVASPHAVHWLLPDPAVDVSVADTGAEPERGLPVAVSGPVWARMLTDGEIAVRRSEALDPAVLPPAVAAFTAILPALYQASNARADGAQLERLRATPDDDGGTGNPLRRALETVASALGHDPRDIPGLPANAASMPIPATMRIAGFRARKVVLEPGWHRYDQGPMLLRTQDGARPVAAIWDGVVYRVDGRALSASDAAAFQHTAFAVSAGLPEKVSGLWSLAWFVMRIGNRRDSLHSGLAAAGAALVGTLVPLATAWLLSDIVPGGIGGLLIAVGIALGCGALVSYLLSTARALAMARIDGRGAMTLAGATTDRVMRLPVRFFKDFAAGDLNQRLENIEQMRRLAVSVTLSAGLTAVLSIVYLAVLLSYDSRLALIAMALVAVYIVAVAIARVLQQGALRAAARLDGEIAGQTYETLEGVAKLRAAAAEDRAMARWLDLYAAERAAQVRAGRVGVNFGAFADGYQTITMMTLFAGAGALMAVEAPAGIFIGFLAAFGAFQGAFVGLSEALLQVYAAQPLVERAKPLLEAEPEVAPGRADPGTLKGAIEGSGIAFAYGEGLPAVLTDLSFMVRPGEHMAIVGGSGSGKSTLLRLLLGFEQPQRGSILYDGQDLAQLDLTRVRSQIGVVLQASQLFAGSILENIRGASNAPLEACLKAVRDAGLERDLGYFAMGIHTPITEGASTLSGGQRQRILIARALAAQPNILFFDEATSALDNRTQAVVAETLDQLAVTRITIAHRLSTVRNADKICVMEQGRFVEQGTYEDLMERNGAFAALARRQLTGD